MQKDLAAKELEIRNTTVLNQLAEMIESLPGMSLIITKLMYEKGMEIPVSSQQNASAKMSTSRSRISMRSSGRNSECSLTVNSHEDDGILSRCLYNCFSLFCILNFHLFC